MNREVIMRKGEKEKNGEKRSEEEKRGEKRREEQIGKEKKMINEK